MGDFFIAPDRAHTAAAHADGGNPDNTSPVADSSLSAAVGRSRLDKKEAVPSPAVQEPVTTVHAFHISEADADSQVPRRDPALTACLQTLRITTWLHWQDIH